MKRVFLLLALGVAALAATVALRTLRFTTTQVDVPRAAAVEPLPGAVADGFVWGRGTLDDKSTVFGILEATESLLSARFRPRRTIHLALGADEEAGGQRGAAVIAKLMATRGIRLLFVPRSAPTPAMCRVRTAQTSVCQRKPTLKASGFLYA